MNELLDAAVYGDLATIIRHHAEGVDVTERGVNGITAIMLAAANGDATMLNFLHAAGASITERNDHGHSAVRYALSYGKLPIVQYFFQEAGARISDATDDDGITVWNLLRLIIQGADPVALTSLLILKIMVMLGDAPPDFVAKLSPAHAELTTRGRQLRAQLPSYLEQQRATVVAHCPLPAVLQPLVGAYAALTPEDMWADGLRVQHVDRPKRPRMMAGADPNVEGQLRRSPRLRQKRA
jgi:hypothetical protein